MQRGKAKVLIQFLLGVSAPVIYCLSAARRCTGQHTFRELQATLAHYRQNGIQPDGCVCNFLLPRRSSYGYHYGYHYIYKNAKR